MKNQAKVALREHPYRSLRLTTKKSDQEIMSIDDRVSNLYKLAKSHADDENLQEAISVVKSLRRSQGGLQGWNGRYREINGELKAEITTISQDNETLKAELDTINQEMLQLAQEKAKILAEKAKVIAELKNIQTEVEVAVIKIRETKSLFGKFSTLWILVKSLFLEDDSEGFGKRENSLPPDYDKPQMESDQASINRSLLDK